MPTPSPAPENTPDGPAYQGRLLPRPDDEVVDQGAAFDVTTLVTRRALLGLVGVGAVATLAACATPGTATTTATATPTGAASATAAAGALPAAEIPDETAGPYPGDGSNGPDVLESSGIVRRDIRSNIGGSTLVDGERLDLTLRITDMANGDAPFAGVAVYAWHCDAQGRYSMYSEGVEGETWLRGVQVADADGQVTFTTIVPGCYLGRWTHIHFEVYPDVTSITDSTTAIATSQVAFPASLLDTVYTLPAYSGSAENLAQVTLASDNVFGEDGGALQIATIGGSASAGYTAALTARVDTTTAPSRGGRR